MMTLNGVVHNFAGLLVLRLLMGMFETGFFLVVVLLMNKWYIQFELSARVSIYYAGAAISGAFSGLLAYGLANMMALRLLQGGGMTFPFTLNMSEGNTLLTSVLS